MTEQFNLIGFKKLARLIGLVTYKAGLKVVAVLACKFVERA